MTNNTSSQSHNEPVSSGSAAADNNAPANIERLENVRTASTPRRSFDPRNVSAAEESEGSFEEIVELEGRLNFRQPFPRQPARGVLRELQTPTAEFIAAQERRLERRAAWPMEIRRIKKAARYIVVRVLFTVLPTDALGRPPRTSADDAGS
ncbi:hypothetical protein GGI05_001417, partial [Coemansia sp. RSA 2603]